MKRSFNARTENSAAVGVSSFPYTIVSVRNHSKANRPNFRCLQILKKFPYSARKQHSNRSEK